jgi:hypothetical protein
MWTSSAGENALQGHDTPDDLVKSLGLSCVRGASLEGRSVTIRRNGHASWVLVRDGDAWY